MRGKRSVATPAQSTSPKAVESRLDWIRIEANERFTRMPALLETARESPDFEGCIEAIDEFISALGNVYTPRRLGFPLYAEMFRVIAAKSTAPQHISRTLHYEWYMRGSLLPVDLWRESKLDEDISNFRVRAVDVLRSYLLYTDTVHGVMAARACLHEYELRDQVIHAEEHLCARKLLSNVRTTEDAQYVLKVYLAAKNNLEHARTSRDKSVFSYGPRDYFFGEALAEGLAKMLVRANEQ